MPLSTLQLEALHQMTLDRKPNYEVSGWLTTECGLDFTEATKERLKAVEYCKKTHEETQRQSETNKTGKEGGSLSSETQASGESSFFRESDKDIERNGEDFEKDESVKSSRADETESSALEKDVYETETKCVTCKDVTSSCKCEVKTVEQIPF